MVTEKTADNPTTASPFKVAILGAGVAGLRCAQILRDVGLSVTAFDKGRGLGGRVATRRVDSNLAFDHGAQYFTASSPSFLAQTQSWTSRGVAQEWLGKIVKLSGAGVADTTPRHRYVGTPGMSALGTDLAKEIAVLRETQVKRVTRNDAAWTLLDQAGKTHGPFDILVMTLPAAQSADLLKDHPLGRQAAGVSMSPCWAVLAGFSERVDLPWDGAFVEGSPISWLARNSSKPGRPTGPDCWVIHAGPEFSLANLEQPAESIAQTLLEEFSRSAGLRLPPRVHLSAHRWRHSQASSNVESLCLFDADARLALCGDWLAGGKIEGAYLSGESAAFAVAKSLGR